MQISLSDGISILSMVIAALAVFISYKAYRKGVPRIIIEVDDPKYDCFFGNVEMYANGRIYNDRISGIGLTIRNNSAVDIEAISARLKIKKEFYRLIDSSHPFWAQVSFLSFDQEKKEFVPDDLYGIQYSERGLHFPQIIKSYSSLSGYVFFYACPFDKRGKVRATLYLSTAIGKSKKRVVLREYDHTFEKQELEDVQQYYRSLGE